MSRWFDRLAEAAARLASRGVFFAGCLLLIVVWAASYFVVHDLDTWQLIINTVTTVVTFLLVALLQNSGRRSDRALHQKLDALADGLADLMDFQLNDDTVDLQRDIGDLKRAVGLERLARPRGTRRRDGAPRRSLSSIRRRLSAASVATPRHTQDPPAA
jgi:low affinity Fe/Cu permease